MISLLYILSLFCFLNCALLNNPVKMKISLMIASFSILFLMKNLSMSSWLPLIYSMLYLGGILMMFMILSSFLPNSKMSVPGKNKVFLMSLVLLSGLPNTSFVISQSSNMKTFLEDKLNLFFMVIWILGVFFGFILILSECRLSMRTLLLK